MTKTLRVILWGEEIGRLAWDERRHLSYFTYNPDFIKKGLNISPLVAPIDGVRALGTSRFMITPTGKYINKYNMTISKELAEYE